MQHEHDQSESLTAPETIPAKPMLIRMDNVFLSTDTREPIFRNLSFSLADGDSAVLIGGAGCGKTSFLELLVGLRFAESGAIELFGQQLKRGRTRAIRSVRRRIGGVGGPFTLIPSMTLRENVAVPLVVSGDGSKLLNDRLTRTLTDLSLLHLSGRFPRQLTRVESTLAQLARATVAGQSLVLIDEPLAGLDRATVEKLLDYLTKLSWSGQSLVITTTEPLPVALTRCVTRRFQNGSLT